MVEGVSIVRPLSPPLEDATFTRCPVAEIRQPDGWVGRIMRTAAQCQAPGVSLRDVLPQPTPAAIEALRVLHEERHHLATYEREQAERERN